jgi:antitoxin component YwqK of YwqJK toxin-antitoxin module
MFYEAGQLQDPTDRDPAVRGYFANGMLHYEEHYRDGKRSDAANGNPAVSKWRADGTLRHQLRYRNGKRITGRHSPTS